MLENFKKNIVQVVILDALASSPEIQEVKAQEREGEPYSESKLLLNACGSSCSNATIRTPCVL